MIRELVAALSLDSLPMVGNSLGGMAALWLAVAEPGLASRVVVLGLPGSVLPGARPDLALAALSIPGINRLLLRLPSNVKRSRALLRQPLGNVAVARVPEEVFEIHYLASRRAEFSLTLSTFMQTTLRWRATRPGVVLSDAEMGRIRQPVHFIWGESDIYGAPAIGRHAAELMPHATLDVRPGGHFPQFDDPGGCGKSIADFLSCQALVAAQQGDGADGPGV